MEDAGEGVGLGGRIELVDVDDRVTLVLVLLDSPEVRDTGQLVFASMGSTMRSGSGRFHLSSLTVISRATSRWSDAYSNREFSRRRRQRTWKRVCGLLKTSAPSSSSVWGGRSGMRSRSSAVQPSRGGIASGMAVGRATLAQVRTRSRIRWSWRSRAAEPLWRGTVPEGQDSSPGHGTRVTPSWAPRPCSQPDLT